ncbi:MAG: hypothetical protein AB1512_24550 [Thermodesulfobacteriota bacterium]
MSIEFSRHAKRRARLYGIPESVILDILAEMDLPQGEHEILRDVAGFRYPLKIVVSVEGGMATVVTNYPLKKGRKK